MSQRDLTTGPYIVRGATGGIPLPCMRYEIRDLQRAHPFQFSLFIQALSRIMGISDNADKNVPRNNPASWEQMASIHGMIYDRWNGDPDASSDPVSPTDWLGYCHHESILFPTWHRVVMLLVEQAVSIQALDIVKDLKIGSPQYNMWTDAARCLRFPFWDWTTPDTLADGFPDIFQVDKVRILALDGTSQSVKNPLANYPLHGLNDQFPDRPLENAYFKEWLRTCRCPPDEKNDQDKIAQDSYATLNDHIQNGGTYYYDDGGKQGTFQFPGWNGVVNSVGQLFTYPTDLDPKMFGNAWGTFSNTKKIANMEQIPGMKGATVEASHNWMHLIIGGQGHMGDNDFAAFDPIFFLHHCNVDRIYAFWEYVYPNYWMNAGYTDTDGNKQSFTATDGTFTEQKGETYDNNTELSPFRKTTGADYWNSDDARGLTPDFEMKFYTYPPIVSDDGKISVQVDQPATDEQRTEYLGVLAKHWQYDPPKEVRQLPRPLKAPFFRLHGGLRGLPETHTVFENYRLFTVNITLNPFAFNGSHLVEVFLHDYPTVVIGAHAVLSRVDPNRCRNCVARRDQGSMSMGRIVVPAIFIYGILESKGLNNENATDEQVVQAVKEAFGARVTTPGHQRLAVAHPRLPVGAEPGESSHPPLDASKVPELAILSAFVSYPRDDPSGAALHVDWQNHGKILGDVWKNTNSEAAANA